MNHDDVASLESKLAKALLAVLDARALAERRGHALVRIEEVARSFFVGEATREQLEHVCIVLPAILCMDDNGCVSCRLHTENARLHQEVAALKEALHGNAKT